jgi:hypothetical protein
MSTATASMSRSAVLAATSAEAIRGADPSGLALGLPSVPFPRSFAHYRTTRLARRGAIRRCLGPHLDCERTVSVLLDGRRRWSRWRPYQDVPPCERPGRARMPGAADAASAGPDGGKRLQVTQRRGGGARGASCRQPGHRKVDGVVEWRPRAGTPAVPGVLSTV